MTIKIYINKMILILKTNLNSEGSESEVPGGVPTPPWLEIILFFELRCIKEWREANGGKRMAGSEWREVNGGKSQITPL